MSVRLINQTIKIKSNGAKNSDEYIRAKTKEVTSFGMPVSSIRNGTLFY